MTNIKYKKTKKFSKNFCVNEFLKCEGYNHKGQGIVKWNNKIFFVDELIIDEEAKIHVYYQNEKYGEARAIILKKWSSKRKLPLGHWKFQLGAYHLPHLKDSEQDKLKQKWVEETFSPHQVKNIIVKKRKNYRNKVLLHHGGFLPPGRWRKKIIIPEKYDLMELDFNKYQNQGENIIIRRLNGQEIFGKPGENKNIIDKMLGKKFIVNLNSFYQVNSQMAQIAYQKIISEVENDNIVFDLFSGASTIAIHIANYVKKVFSIEINKASYNDAIKNIELNNISNIEAINADVHFWIKNNNIKPDTIILDPSRKGLSQLSMEIINNLKAKQIIYLSCNIFSQKKDIEFLTNYKIVEIQPYDFFPQTYHIENLVILKLKN